MNAIYPTRKLNKEVLRLAIPSILASVTIPLVGMVDTAIVGHIADATAIGGIAIGTMLFDLLYWNFGFLRVGTGGMTAQAYGRQDKKTMADILAQSIGIAFLASLLIWAMQWLFVHLVLWFVPCSEEVSLFAQRYFFVRVWAAPATLSLLALKGWFIGMQDTVAPMVCDLVVNIVNVIASYWLAVKTPLGALGVAHGTVVAQYTGLIVAALLLCKYRTILKELDWKHCIRWKEMRKLFVLNGNLFVRSLCFMVVYVGFTTLAAKYGDTELAVSSIIMKLLMLYSYFLDGFAYAGEALTGRFFGEKNKTAVRSLVKILFLWALAIGVVSTVAYAVGGEWMVRIMTNDTAIILCARKYLFWLVLMPLLSCAAFLWDGIYIGATAGKEVRNCMIFAAITFVIGYIGLEHFFMVQALYIAYFLHLVVRTIYMTAKWKSVQQRIDMNDTTYSK